MPVTEELYVNSFDAAAIGWNRIGASPYLQDLDTSYINTNVDARDIRNFGFPASAGSDTINSVKIRFEAKRSLSADSVFYLWNGAAWSAPIPITINTASYSWFEIDVSAILNTWAKINAALIWLSSEILAGGTVYVRRCTRKVDYTLPAVAGEFHGDGLVGWSE
jgi:hypothetical protein